MGGREREGSSLIMGKFCLEETCLCGVAFN